MIKSFRNGDSEKVFKRRRVKRFPLAIQKRAQRKLELMDGADRIEDLRIPPGKRLEKPTGIRKGQYSIRVNDQ